MFGLERSKNGKLHQFAFVTSVDLMDNANKVIGCVMLRLFCVKVDWGAFRDDDQTIPMIYDQAFSYFFEGLNNQSLFGRISWAEPVKVSLFGESGCPDTIGFIFGALAKAEQAEGVADIMSFLFEESCQ